MEAPERVELEVLSEVPFPETANGLVLSPRGEHVVFYRPALGNVPSLARVDGRDVRELPNQGNAGRAAWSPDGDYIAYLSTDDHQPGRWMEVRVFSVRSGKVLGAIELEPRDVGPAEGGIVLDDAHPAWSPDGKDLYYLTLAGLYRVDMRDLRPGGGSRLVPQLVTCADAFPGHMHWLARGPVAWDGQAQLLAFCTSDGAAQGQVTSGQAVAEDDRSQGVLGTAGDELQPALWVVDREGGAVVRVPQPGIAADGSRGHEVLGWSPDGKKLVWVTAQPVSLPAVAAPQAYRLFVLDLESGRVSGYLSAGLGDRPVRLQGCSPDGKQVALLVSPGAGEGWELWFLLVSTAGGEGSERAGAVVPRRWGGEKLMEAHWLSPDRLLGLTADYRLLVLKLGQ
ncbi:MAG: TolB family protein [Bacillota bacterium]